DPAPRIDGTEPGQADRRPAPRRASPAGRNPSGRGGPCAVRRDGGGCRDRFPAGARYGDGGNCHGVVPRGQGERRTVHGALVRPAGGPDPSSGGSPVSRRPIPPDRPSRLLAQSPGRRTVSGAPVARARISRPRAGPLSRPPRPRVLPPELPPA